jgi:hypothetical protein
MDGGLTRLRVPGEGRERPFVGGTIGCQEGLTSHVGPDNRHYINTGVKPIILCVLCVA